MGSSAPQLKNLAAWLESHPAFDVAAESVQLVREKVCCKVLVFFFGFAFFFSALKARSNGHDS